MDANRRVVLVGIAGEAVFRPLTAPAQQAGRTYRLGFVVQQPRPKYSDLVDELGRLGFVETDNLDVDARGFSLTVERLEPVAMEVSSAQPDAIFAGGDAAARAAQRATGTIPIVRHCRRCGEQSIDFLARPSRRQSNRRQHPRWGAKRQTARVADRNAPRHSPDCCTGRSSYDHPRTTDCSSRGVPVARLRELVVHRAETREQIAPAIDAARMNGAQALNVFASALLNANRALIIERSAAARLPAIYQFPELCEEGGLAGYGSRLSLLHRQAAGMLAKY